MPSLPIIFLAVAALCFAPVIFVTLPSRRARKSARRLVAVTALPQFEVRAAQTKTREAIAGKKIDAYIQESELNNRLSKMLLQARVKLKAGDFLLLCALSCTMTFLLTGLLARSIAIGAIAALPGSMLPLLWLIVKRARRLKAFNAELPNTIDLIARALRAGHSVQQALEVVAEQTRDPIREEFAQVHQEQKLGVPFRDALMALGERVPLQDLRFMVTATLVQKETGGDLIQILERTAHVIRERLRVLGEIRTYTAQGRLTGWLLTALPIVLLLVISAIIPGYSTILFTDPLGRMMLAVGAVMVIMGGFIIRRIVDIEV